MKISTVTFDERGCSDAMCRAVSAGISATDEISARLRIEMAVREVSGDALAFVQSSAFLGVLRGFS
jgi:hypothetical protein